MFKFFVLTFFLFISFSINGNENSLTIQQQLERLQREVSDLSQSVFSNKDKVTTNQNNELTSNLSAIDMRIYDLEKDVKSLTGNLEEIFFQLDDLNVKIDSFKEIITLIENKLLEINNTSKENQNENTDIQVEENTLGSLKINSDDTIDDNTNVENKVQEDEEEDLELSPEDQFQAAFDNIRSKNWETAKKSFIQFIEDNPNNQLSGSAHYWLGELYILEKNYREAALIFAEGFQKFPDSIKAAEMLFKLSQSLYQVEKTVEACKTMEKLIIDFPKNKIIPQTKKQIIEYNCLENNE